MIRVLSKSDIEKLMDLPLALEAVERAYVQKSSGQGGVWPMVFHDFAPRSADLDIKSGDLGSEGVYGLKVVSWNGGNPAMGLPALYGTSLIFDLETGAPSALLNAGPITSFRTGAAAAIGAKYLARPNAKRLLMVGCGTQAPFLVAAALCALPRIESVAFCNPRSPAAGAERLPALKAKVETLLRQAGSPLHAEIDAMADLEAAVSQADVILTATPSYQPLIPLSWVKPGTHFSCIGADMSGKQELDTAILASAAVFGDDAAQCFAVGECEIPHSAGALPALKAEIGAVISGASAGRESAGELTVFDSTGIALQDLACAAAILKKAEAAGIGTLLEL